MHAGGGLLGHQECPEGSDLHGVLNLGRDEFNEGSARTRAGVVNDQIRGTLFALDVGK
jgi:hypothetical protein